MTTYRVAVALSTTYEVCWQQGREDTRRSASRQKRRRRSNKGLNNQAKVHLKRTEQNRSLRRRARRRERAGPRATRSPANVQTSEHKRSGLPTSDFHEKIRTTASLPRCRCGSHFCLRNTNRDDRRTVHSHVRRHGSFVLVLPSLTMSRIKSTAARPSENFDEVWRISTAVTCAHRYEQAMQVSTLR